MYVTLYEDTTRAIRTVRTTTGAWIVIRSDGAISPTYTLADAAIQTIKHCISGKWGHIAWTINQMHSARRLPWQRQV